MSEQSPNIADLSRSELSAEEYLFSINVARDAIELRKSFTRTRPDLRVTDATKDLAVKLADYAIGNLWRLGLNMDDTSDDRITGVLLGAEVIKKADNFGPERYHPTNRPETAFWSNYERVLTGLDMSSPDRLQLVTQEDLVKRHMLYEVAAAALAYTSGDEFTLLDSFGRKAQRTITDPASNFWNVSVHTDTYPGKEIGGSYTQGPNISVSMPTGLFTARSLRTLREAPDPNNPVWKETIDNGYVLPYMTVQNVHFGNQHPYDDNFDTPSGYVQKFIEYANEQ